jgi:hypothetical protein
MGASATASSSNIAVAGGEVVEEAVVWALSRSGAGTEVVARLLSETDPASPVDPAQLTRAGEPKRRLRVSATPAIAARRPPGFRIALLLMPPPSHTG